MNFYVLAIFYLLRVSEGQRHACGKPEACNFKGGTCGWYANGFDLVYSPFDYSYALQFIHAAGAPGEVLSRRVCPTNGAVSCLRFDYYHDNAMDFTVNILELSAEEKRFIKRQVWSAREARAWRGWNYEEIPVTTNNDFVILFRAQGRVYGDVNSELLIDNVSYDTAACGTSHVFVKPEQAVRTTSPPLVTTTPKTVTTTPAMVTTKPTIVTKTRGIVTTTLPIVPTAPAIVTTTPQIMTSTPPIVTTPAEESPTFTEDSVAPDTLSAARAALMVGPAVGFIAVVIVVVVAVLVRLCKRKKPLPGGKMPRTEETIVMTELRRAAAVNMDAVTVSPHSIQSPFDTSAVESASPRIHPDLSTGFRQPEQSILRQDSQGYLLPVPWSEDCHYENVDTTNSAGQYCNVGVDYCSPDFSDADRERREYTSLKGEPDYIEVC